MKFDDEQIRYLTGEKFSSCYTFKFFQEEKNIIVKPYYMQSIVQNKNIIHFGCVDHIPLIKNKIENSYWMHKVLCDSASYCLGIDNNSEGIEYIKSLGYKNVLCMDLLKDSLDNIIVNQNWEYIILGDVLEHINNPVSFLKELKEKFKNCVKELLITVPNALKYSNCLNLFRHTETVNSDHRFWFTPYTLSKVVLCSGITPIEIKILNSYPPRSSVLCQLYKRFPLLNDTIFLRCKL